MLKIKKKTFFFQKNFVNKIIQNMCTLISASGCFLSFEGSFKFLIKISKHVYPNATINDNDVVLI